ncbi:unnamed protein product [Camellia sinensis]
MHLQTTEERSWRFQFFEVFSELILPVKVSFRRKKTLHKACEDGDLESVEELIRENKDLFWEEAVKEVTAKTMRTCVHVAVNHNQIETIRVSLPLNPGGSVALDISYDLPHLENIDFEIDGIGEKPSAMIDWDLTKQKIIHSDLYSDNGSYDIPQSENMDIEIDGTLQQRRATLAWDLTKQKIKHNDVYGDNGSYDLPQSENMHIRIGKIRQEPNLGFNQTKNQAQ